MSKKTQKVVVLGAGKSGLAAATFLAGQGAEVVLSDSRPETEITGLESLPRSVSRVFGSHPDSLMDERPDFVVLSPGIPTTAPIVRRAHSASIPVVSEIELAFRHLKGKVVAITGSNGKSTTTALIGEILRIGGQQPIVAGNIGEPLIAAIDTASRTYVVELSSFQLETVETFRADIALLLNITPDHMDRYTTLDDYARAKHNIFQNQRYEDLAIVNADDPRTANPGTKARVWRFSSTRAVQEGAYLDGDDLVLIIEGSERRIPRKSLRLSGVANVENALAGWLAARALGVSDVDVQIAFGSFAGLPHRMVLVRELDGVEWINDSKGTNVDATMKSLQGLEDGSVLLILGGKDKNGEFERLEEFVRKKVRLLFTIGSSSARIVQALGKAVPTEEVGDMKRAVERARQLARKGETVLLSPACASFDQYKNFEDRGRNFEELVRAL